MAQRDQRVTRKLRRESKAKMDAYEAVFTALAHPARRRIMLTINFEGGSMTAGEIADVFEHAWPTTTRHIQVLEAAGLLYHEQQGRVRTYYINRSRLDLVRDWLEWFAKDPH
ncbi:MAG TPA: helix-turn-helix domain-containing protein [Pyrinomonadaceae bacterium]|nr:helix-turn-helix domain-containing protein [Pyrinomonadaceae bacterium]